MERFDLMKRIMKASASKPSDPFTKVYPIEMVGRCIHEAGHAAMFWYCGNSFHDDTDLTLATTSLRREIDHFRTRDGFSPEMIRQFISTGDSTSREVAIVQGEERIQVLLGGPLSERRFIGYPRPIRAVRREASNPAADAYKIREYIIALLGKDNHRYQIQLQNKVWTALTEPRTWEAIERTAWKLYQQRHLSGSEIETIFEKANAPIQWVALMNEPQ